MRFVPVKDVDQQARLSWHRVREGYKVESLAIGNRLRGLLAEFGIVVAKSDVALRRVLADLDQQTALPGEFKELLRNLSAHWTAGAHGPRRVRCTHRRPCARGRTVCAPARDHRYRPDHRRCDGRHAGLGQGISQRPATGRVAGFGADPALQWRPCPLGTISCRGDATCAPC
jgi:transposase